MVQTNAKKDLSPTQVRLVVEVDGNPVGFLSLDLDRLWPLINHRKRDLVPVEWLEAAKFESLMRASVMRRRRYLAGPRRISRSSFRNRAAQRRTSITSFGNTCSMSERLTT